MKNGNKKRKHWEGNDKKEDDISTMVVIVLIVTVTMLTIHLYLLSAPADVHQTTSEQSNTRQPR